MTSFGYRLNPRYAIKECLSCGALYTGDFCCSKGNVEDKILVTKFPENYASTNVVNAHREPFVFKWDHCVNPPHIDECCCECGDVLDGIFCQQCTCKSCGKAAHIGYNCPPKVLIISNPELCNQTMNNEPPQTLPGFDQTQPLQFSVIHPPPQETSIKILLDQENAINFVQTFLRKFNHYSFFETPKVLLLAWDRVFEIKDAFETKQYKPEDMQELFRKLSNDVQNIHEELAKYINTPGWNRPAYYDDDDDDDVDNTIAITPVLSTEKPDNSLSMGDEHLDTIPATESDEVIKSSVEDLVPIPSEFE
nr:hypothetical protein [Tanacetum cinerariifolium]